MYVCMYVQRQSKMNTFWKWNYSRLKRMNIVSNEKKKGTTKFLLQNVSMLSTSRSADEQLAWLLVQLKLSRGRRHLLILHPKRAINSLNHKQHGIHRVSSLTSPSSPPDIRSKKRQSVQDYRHGRTAKIGDTH